MNSPPDPDSPSPSTPSSGSPPPEEANYNPSGSASQLANIASQISASFAGNNTKRRLPGGSSFGAAASTRDPKLRRRGDTSRANTWEAKDGGKREKEELIDHGLVEYLRKGCVSFSSVFPSTCEPGTDDCHAEIGDPFQDAKFKRMS